MNEMHVIVANHAISMECTFLADSRPPQQQKLPKRIENRIEPRRFCSAIFQAERQALKIILDCSTMTSTHSAKITQTSSCELRSSN